MFKWPVQEPMISSVEAQGVKKTKKKIPSRTRPQQLELGFPSMHAQVLPRLISQLNSYLLDFDFFSTFLSLEIHSSTEEFELYNSLKHSLVLST